MAEQTKRATVMLLSGDMDKALFAFILATGYASMGIETKMWFTLWGANCLKRRRGFWSTLFGLRKKGPTEFRRTENDSFVQNIVEAMSAGGANHMPLSQLNMLGMGPKTLNYLLKRKGIPNLEQMIGMAEELEIPFTICQICVDALALDTSDLIVSKQVDVKGISQYVKDTMASHYNVVL
jgi:peroxiredoxin family protein